MIFFPFINQRYIFMETETRYEANRHCCFFLALSNITGKVHLIFCLSGHAVTSKYAWIAMSLIHVINIYCRIFPIENAVCSIYSSFIHKKFHYMMVFGKNHLQFFFLMVLYYFKHYEISVHYWGTIQYSFCRIRGCNSIYSSFTKTNKKILLHYGLWGKIVTINFSTMGVNIWI